MSEKVLLRGVGKTFHQGGVAIEVLKNLDLEVSAGETLAIVGQSGSGKSTLLSLLAGLDQPSQGTIQIGPATISALNQEELARFRAKSLGIVFQQFHLMSSLTALENVGLPLEIARDPDFQAKAEEALKEVGLAHRQNHWPAQLSGGEKQRVAIARALVVKPKLLLADEPSGSLDTRTGKQVMDALFSLSRAQGMTLILVTHSPELAARCDRICRLEEGRML